MDKIRYIGYKPCAEDNDMVNMNVIFIVLMSSEEFFSEFEISADTPKHNKGRLCYQNDDMVNMNVIFIILMTSEDLYI